MDFGRQGRVRTAPTRSIRCRPSPQALSRCSGRRAPGCASARMGSANAMLLGAVLGVRDVGVNIQRREPLPADRHYDEPVHEPELGTHSAFDHKCQPNTIPSNRWQAAGGANHTNAQLPSSPRRCSRLHRLRWSQFAVPRGKPTVNSTWLGVGPFSCGSCSRGGVTPSTSTSGSRRRRGAKSRTSTSSAPTGSR